MNNANIREENARARQLIYIFALRVFLDDTVFATHQREILGKNNAVNLLGINRPIVQNCGFSYLAFERQVIIIDLNLCFILFFYSAISKQI